MKGSSNKQRGFRSRDRLRLRPRDQSAAEGPSWTQPQATRIGCVGTRTLWSGEAQGAVFKA
jgi:hypothetical protein